MEKNDLKMYAAPELELVELEVEGQLLAGSPTGPTGGGSDDIPAENIDPGFGS